MQHQHEGIELPPAWQDSDSVLVFDPSMSKEEIEAKYNAAAEILNDRFRGHFSDRRVAALFLPGIYDVDIKVGYYTQVSVRAMVDQYCH